MKADDFRFHQAVLEVRYPKTHTYWDSSGELLSTLESRLPGLTCQQLGTDGFKFTGGDGSGIASASFYWNKAIAVQSEHGPLSKFSEEAAEFWRLVANVLKIGTTERVGHRVWFYLPTESAKDASEWLRATHLWTFANPTAATWGRPHSDGVTLRTRMAKDDRAVRIEVDAADVQNPKSTTPVASGVLVDVDFALETKRPAGEVAIAEFIRWNTRFVRENVANLFSSVE